MPLTPQELVQYEKEGYVTMVNYLSKETVAELNAEIDTLLHSVHIKNHPKIRFLTGEDKQGHIGDKYFFDSADKIHYFFEPEALIDEGNNHNLVLPLDKSINKIGHGLHFLNEKFNKITVNDDVASICRQLGFQDPKAVQSMCIIKQPHIGAAVPPHNDAEFLFTKPDLCVGFWFALQDCTINNGCLEFIPGSQDYPLRKRFVKDFKKGGTKFGNLNNPEEDYLPTPDDEEFQEKINDQSIYEKAIIPAGTSVLINGKTIHKSGKNKTDKSRNAYTFHVVDGAADYDKYNWLQIPPNKPAGSENFTRLFKNYE